MHGTDKTRADFVIKGLTCDNGSLQANNRFRYKPVRIHIDMDMKWRSTSTPNKPHAIVGEFNLQCPGDRVGEAVGRVLGEYRPWNMREMRSLRDEVKPIGRPVSFRFTIDNQEFNNAFGNYINDRDGFLRTATYDSLKRILNLDTTLPVIADNFTERVRSMSAQGFRIRPINIEPFNNTRTHTRLTGTYNTLTGRIRLTSPDVPYIDDPSRSVKEPTLIEMCLLITPSNREDTNLVNFWRDILDAYRALNPRFLWRLDGELDIPTFTRWSIIGQEKALSRSGHHYRDQASINATFTMMEEDGDELRAMSAATITWVIHNDEPFGFVHDFTTSVYENKMSFWLTFDRKFRVGHTFVQYMRHGIEYLRNMPRAAIASIHGSPIMVKLSNLRNSHNQFCIFDDNPRLDHRIYIDGVYNDEHRSFDFQLYSTNSNTNTNNNTTNTSNTKSTIATVVLKMDTHSQFARFMSDLDEISVEKDMEYLRATYGAIGGANDANNTNGANRANGVNDGNGANRANRANDGNGANRANGVNDGNGANRANRANDGDGANRANRANDAIVRPRKRVRFIEPFEK
jgi:hypothetical protein